MEYPSPAGGRAFSETSSDKVQEAPKTEQPSVKEKLPDPKQAKYRFREFELADRIFIVTGKIRMRNEPSNH